jgi:Family of unknown function (DUF5996)
MAEAWPDIPYLPWRDSCAALHLWAQIVGKYRLANTPWLNHSWHATLYVDARGLTTGLVPDGPGIEIAFDFQRHTLVGVTTDGRSAEFPLGPMSVADFLRQFLDLLSMLGGNPRFNGRPHEVVSPVPFAEDLAERPYDGEAVARFFGACVSIDRVFKRFRTGFLGKVSPVHLFWGSFDLAVTRFSGRLAPRHPGGVPALPDAVTREAYSHQVSSAGFWPGGGGVDYAAFYSYAYPPPPGFSQTVVAPAEAFFHETLGEFLLPYDAVRRAADPEAMLMAFLGSTYRAAADAGQWDSAALECLLGVPGVPRGLAR